jgi:hypothetical protein
MCLWGAALRVTVERTGCCWRPADCWQQPKLGVLRLEKLQPPWITQSGVVDKQAVPLVLHGLLTNACAFQIIGVWNLYWDYLAHTGCVTQLSP